MIKWRSTISSSSLLCPTQGIVIYFFFSVMVMLTNPSWNFISVSTIYIHKMHKNWEIRKTINRFIKIGALTQSFLLLRYLSKRNLEIYETKSVGGQNIISSWLHCRKEKDLTLYWRRLRSYNVHNLQNLTNTTIHTGTDY